MTTTISCPSCRRGLHADPEVFGKKVSCTRCGAAFIADPSMRRGRRLRTALWVLVGCGLVLGVMVWRPWRPDALTIKAQFKAALDGAGGWGDIEWSSLASGKSFQVSATHVVGQHKYVFLGSVSGGDVFVNSPGRGFVWVCRQHPRVQQSPKTNVLVIFDFDRWGVLETTDKNTLPSDEESQVRQLAQELIAALRKAV